MKIIKNINNNFALAVDGAGHRVVVSGRGIGFGAVGREITDLNQINRSFYDIDDIYISMINSVPEETIALATAVMDKARSTIKNQISSNIVFTLADHINFCVQRYKKKMSITIPMAYDVRYLYEDEYEVGVYGLKLINEHYKLKMPLYEASYIALHIINAEEKVNNVTVSNEEDVVNDITDIVEKIHGISIDRNDFNYSRFVTHIYYLLKRGESKHLIKTENSRIYQQIKEDFPTSCQSSEAIGRYLYIKMNFKLTEEEQLYLMLHINRLCTREDSKKQ